MRRGSYRAGRTGTDAASAQWDSGLGRAQAGDAPAVAPRFEEAQPSATYAQRGKTVEITGLNDPGARLHDRLSGELVGGH
ncbi:hypothetical protein GCM10009535_43680 [Streptomyces thermocarboxydovorans]|uniref:Uncharacterized protein n=1 Tax=Streptomyces thermocarboxydovorans TaxID=59298 RepID=A0ABN1HMQ5_9ACTN